MQKGNDRAPLSIHHLFLLIVTFSVSVAGCGPGFGNAKPWTAALNSWLGISKDERVKRVGVPTACTVLSTGEEVCDWVNHRLAGSSFSYADKYGGVGSGFLDTEEHRVTFTYDREHIARFWSYNGSLGSFTSQAPPSPKSYEKTRRSRFIGHSLWHNTMNLAKR
jgi:hypothetical protein